MQNISKRVGIAIFVWFVSIFGSPLAAQEFEVLASFDNPPQFPTGGLVIGPEGLYGVAGGGSFDYGSIFRFVPPRTTTAASLEKIFSFSDTDYDANLGQPTHGLVYATDGNFYGLRTGGSWSGYTAAYRMAPDGEQELLHFFEWPGDGGNPEGPLVEFDGALYGTCRWGGDPDLPSSQWRGTVFRLEFDGTMNTIHTFTGGVNGDRPEGGLVVGHDGLLYGTTLRGGQHGFGTIFNVDPVSGVVEVLHSFDPNTEGSGPTGELTVGEDGALYGAATYGDNTFQICGTVFRFDSDAESDPLTVLKAFLCAAGETKHPTGGMVIADGYLYGTTYGDSIDWRFGDGVVFRLDLETLAFDTLWSHHPSVVVNGSLLAAPDGLIYGQGSGRSDSTWNTGTILRIDPNTGSVEALYEFGPSHLPRKPFSLVEGEPGELLIVAREGGATNRGSVFRFAEDGAISIVHEFIDGAPLAAGGSAFLTRGSDGLFYGTRSNGGGEGRGSVFSLDLEGRYTGLYGFDGVYPWADSRPLGALIESSFEPGVFYGTLAGSGLDGGVFAIDDSGNLTYLALNDSLTGSPRGRLLQTNGGMLYGVISEWYDISGYGYGGLFRVGPSGGLSRFRELSRNEGQLPQAGLTARTSAGGAFFYGHAPQGGMTHNGTVFKLSEAEEFVVVHSFNGDDGSEPLGELVLAADNHLYGTTSDGGAFGYGSLFAVTPDDEIVTLHHFDHTTGAFPQSALIVGEDGNVYGVTIGGGPGGGGVVFRYVLQPELTVEERIEELIIDVRELIDDGEINNGRGRSLIAELQVALWFLQWNNGERQAIVRLQLFIKKVEIMVRTDQVDPDLGAELIAKAEAILEMLEAVQSS